MSATGLNVFDMTIQETNHWLRIVMDELKTDNRRLAFAALRGVLHTLRDRIGVANAVHLGAQLPMLLRGAYYEGWRPSETPSRERHIEDFLDHVGAELPRKLQLSPAEAVRASFAALAECLDRGEVDKLGGILPAEFRLLWPGDLIEAEPQSVH